MFVQLRRMVYLLVLLQWCVCVSYATCNDSDLVDSDKMLGTLRNEANGYIVEGRVCMAEMAERVRMCNESEVNATRIAEEAANSVNEVGVLVVGGGDTTSGEVITKEKIDDLEVKVKLAEKNVQETWKAVEESAKLMHLTDLAKWSCFASLGNLRATVGRINDSRVYFDYVMGSGPGECVTEEREQLKKDLKNITDELSLMEVKMKWGFRDAVDVKKTAVEGMNAAKKVMSDTVTKYNEILVKMTEKLAKKSQDGEDMKKLSDIQEAVNTSKKSLDTIVNQSEASTKSRRLLSDVSVKVVNETRGSESVTFLQLIRESPNDPLENLKERASAELKVKLRNAEKEETERIKRVKQAEAERIRLAKEREERERARALDREKRLAKEKQERERAEAEKLDEEEKRREQEKAESERRVKEEETKRERLAEDVKARKEKEEKLAKRAKGRKDGSNGPTLDPCPLLLLLMCVLGCTFVC
ncbi:uncharacterized protein TM35_000331730 [Trypanosoma theileri]|uniref:Uncharacterized protein n=1 Tax=Trypanosoma theileri TaxID=67003 RepID=A0A1X0NLY1_9TRYP|nr:uncharacterized protein TM35_000331730 [Trypanosoma theileri]ORC85716.1 hypothetical protein TM35_000331730 [Trypanosoma theileri]